MKQPKVTKYALLPQDRAQVLSKFLRDVGTAIEAYQKQYGFKLHCSYEGNFVEVYDPKAKVRDGYSYVGSIYIDDGVITAEVDELVLEDRVTELPRDRKQLSSGS
jgi:hypothetical protein